LIQYGKVLVENGEVEKAEVVLRECLSIREKAFDEDDWLVANTRSVLGGCLVKLLKFGEAEGLLTEAAELLEENEDTPGKNKVKAIERVVELYEVWEEVEPGKGYGGKAAEWRGKLPKDGEEVGGVVISV